jgi:hypothetical protein
MNTVIDSAATQSVSGATGQPLTRSATKVLSFPHSEELHAESVTSSGSASNSGPQRTQVSTLQPVIPFDQLYQAQELGTKEFVAAVRLLAEAASLLSEAKTAAERSEEVTADNFMIHFEHLLPRLFACRKIGDGFANVTNAVQLALANRNGLPLEKMQIVVLWRIFRQLATGPFLSFDDSISLIDDLDQANLWITDPTLNDWICSGPSNQDG